VLPDRMCIPLEGPYRVEEHRGIWYVLGEHRAIACESEREAQLVCERLERNLDAHALAAEALEGLPREFQVVEARP
jgi:hypothetical protein